MTRVKVRKRVNAFLLCSLAETWHGHMAEDITSLQIFTKLFLTRAKTTHSRTSITQPVLGKGQVTVPRSRPVTAFILITINRGSV